MNLGLDVIQTIMGTTLAVIAWTGILLGVASIVLTFGSFEALYHLFGAPTVKPRTIVEYKDCAVGKRHDMFNGGAL